MHAQVHIDSEIGPLRRVIVHRPDEGIARISPRRAGELLFDDIVYLPQMQAEHDIFRQVLEAFVGPDNVLETQQLLKEAIEHDEQTRAWMIERVIEYEELPRSYKPLLEALEADVLAETLITGYHEAEDLILFDPIPNFIFTRDIAAVVNDHVIITRAAKEARFRENFLTRLIFWSHPIFRGMREEGKLINLNHVDDFPPNRRGEVVRIEGGDIMMLNRDYLLIGCSERTNAHAIHSLARVLFEKRVVKNVVQINIPTDRSFMHIDTIFTQIHRHHVVAFKPIVLDGLSSNVEVLRHNGTSSFYHSIRDFLINEINPNIEFILSGKGISPYQEREQWTDACNLFAVKPGVAITYDRNPHTEEALRAADYQIMHAYDFLEAVGAGTLEAQALEMTIITLPSNELSRGRGGAHCMTCPIERM